MASVVNVRAEIAKLTASRPDPEHDPVGFRRVNDEITRAIDLSRAWQQGDKQQKRIV